MISCLPDSYPDELLYSIWARYSDRVDYPNIASILNELFGKEHLNPIIDLPCHLKHFVDNLPHEQNHTTDYFIDCHTLLPFYSPFLPQERLNHIREQMLTHETAGLHRCAGIGSGRKPLPPNWLRYCPLCVKEERANLGECYWHRLHQVPGVEICSTHMVFLENSTNRARSGLNGSGIFSAESTIKNITPRTATSSPFFKALMEIATDARYLLEHPLSPRETGFFRQQYRSLLAQEDFMTPQGLIRFKEYLKAFTEYYSQELLTLLQCDITSSGPLARTWLAKLTHLERPNSYGAFHHPLYHILAIRFLHTRVEEFFLNDFIAPTHFGLGPWPCLNPVCDHYRQKNILTYQVAEAKGRVVGIFTCSCGFKYSRIGPDASPDDVFRKSKIRSYGDLWETKLRELWSDPTVSYKDIASCLGIYFTNVRSHAVRLHLAIPRGSSTSSQAEIIQNKTIKDCSWYRSEWLIILKEAPGEPIYKLRRRAKGVYTWLRRNDVEFFLSHSPSRNTEGQARVQKSKALQEKLQQEDAINRDGLMAEAIRSAANRLMHAEGFPKRVSITSICKEIPELRRKPESNETTVITQVLHEVIETFEAFAVRRIKYVLQKYLEEQVNPKRYEFIYRAHLKSILQNPLVQQTLDEALIILS